MPFMRTGLVLFFFVEFHLSAACTAEFFAAGEEVTYERALDCAFRHSDRLHWALRLQIQPSFSPASEILVARTTSGQYILRHALVSERVHEFLQRVRQPQEIISALASGGVRKRSMTLDPSQAKTWISEFFRISNDTAVRLLRDNQVAREGSILVQLDGTTYIGRFSDPMLNVEISAVGPDNKASAKTSAPALSVWMRDLESRALALLSRSQDARNNTPSGP